MNGKERFLSVIEGREPDRVPVFPLLMSFAAKRHGLTYREFASDGHALAEAQLRMREAFPLDAITACSDAFRVSADLGGNIVFPDETPPHLTEPLVRTEGDLARLRRPDVSNPKGRMADRLKAVREMTNAAGNECMVLGWVEMPFAEACSLCGVSEFMMMLYDDPALAHRILDFLAGIDAEFAVAQLEAGAPMVGAGDAAASLISPKLYREFALPYEQRVCEAVHDAGGLLKLHICGNTSALLGDMARTGADLFNIDHMVDFKTSAETYSRAGKAFKGNIDPVSDMLFATPEQCAQRAGERLEMARGMRFMLSPGCEVPAKVSDDVFNAFCSVPRKHQNR